MIRNSRNITIINGTNRIGNKTQRISLELFGQSQALGLHPSFITLDNFQELFRGTYITLEDATGDMRQDLLSMEDAGMLVFVVPTYHHGIPSPLKNFLDTIEGRELFDGKIIGLISSNAHSQTDGARQASEVINGILSHEKVQSFVLPRITSIDHSSIDKKRLKDFLIQLFLF